MEKYKLLSSKFIMEILNFCSFTAVRSSGPGGQHVNKASTAVILKFDLLRCDVLDDFTKNRLQLFAKSRINSTGELIIRSENSRSQYQNKEDAINRLLDIITQAQKRNKARIKISASRADNRKRIDSKKKRGETKKLRKKFKF